jgi:allophanate hydrolase
VFDAVWVTRIAPAPASDGPLKGATLAVKDNIDVAGAPTTAGHPAFTFTPDTSAVAVQHLVDIGAVVIGKTNLDQFATGLVGTRSPYGACRNPYVPDRIAGGSSSGSAVAVATGQADLGLTTDTAGSGRVPAALCGLVGVKPSRGLVSTRGVVPAIAGVDCVGLVAQGLGLAATAFDAMAQYDPLDPWSRRPPASTEAPSGTLRIGVPREAEGLDPAGAEAWRAALVALDALGPVVDVDLRPLLDAGALLYGGAFVAARWHAFGEFLASHPDGADPTVRAIVMAAADVPAHRLVADLGRLQVLRRRFDSVWEGVDVVAVPTVGSAPGLEEVARDPVGVNASLGRWTAGVNLLDLCAAAVPCGRRADGVPFGVSFLAPAFADEVAISAAARLMGEPEPPPPRWAGWASVVVVGAHLSGQPLNPELVRSGGRLIREVTTAPWYRLYALATDPPRPGLVRVGSQGSGCGASVRGELWALPVEALGRLVRDVPLPLCIGTIALADGSQAPGFLCEAWAVELAEDITVHGGWVEYLRARSR